jgi:hypothetical protein
LVQLNGRFCYNVELRIVDSVSAMGPIWAKTSRRHWRIFSAALT